jgi:hypothetical protein
MIALGKCGERGSAARHGNFLLISSWCKSSPVKAVAGRPVASIAIHRVTGGCRSVCSKRAGRED